MRLQLMLSVGTLVLPSVELAAQSAAPKSAAPPAGAVYVRPLQPGQLVAVDGTRRLHVECKGPERGPTVIIEAGLSQFTAHGSYGAAQDSIARIARVCTYDRAGLGWSDPSPSAPTHDTMVDDLHRLLEVLHARKPFVMVGHSMGGLLVRRYTQRFPTEVAAVVLLDATPELMLYTPEAAAERKALVARFASGLTNAKPGVPLVAMPAGTPLEVMLAFTPEVMAALQREYEAIDRVPEAMRGAQGYGLLGARRSSSSDEAKPRRRQPLRTSDGKRGRNRCLRCPRAAEWLSQTGQDMRSRMTSRAWWLMSSDRSCASWRRESECRCAAHVSLLISPRAWQLQVAALIIVVASGLTTDSVRQALVTRARAFPPVAYRVRVLRTPTRHRKIRTCAGRPLRIVVASGRRARLVQNTDIGRCK